MLASFVKIATVPRTSVFYSAGFIQSFKCFRTAPLMASAPKIEDSASDISAEIAHPGKLVRKRENPALMKVDSEEFRSIFTPELDTLVELFKKYNHELRIAGGAVRDILMNIKPKDIDFATTATPHQMMHMFTKENVRMINTKGEKHGTVTPRINDKENFEVTTLRIDVRTDGRHADVVFITDWLLDANRRDLTINSMFLGFDGTVYDYFYGYDDLKQRRVVFVGVADERIKEDYLRILRYFRFYGRIAADANSHDQESLAAIKANASGLGRITGERIWKELQKIVVGNLACELIKEMQNCQILEYCGLPAQPNITEFERLCKDLQNFDEPHYPILYLIALLHNSEQAMNLHERLRLSAHERDLALFITQQRNRVDSEYVSLRDYQKLCLKPNIKRDYLEQLLKYTNKLELYTKLKAWKLGVFPVNGNMLRSYDLEAKRYGAALNELRLLWADSDFTLNAEQLLEKLPAVIEKLPSSSPRSQNKRQRTI